MVRVKWLRGRLCITFKEELKQYYSLVEVYGGSYTGALTSYSSLAMALVLIEAGAKVAAASTRFVLGIRLMSLGE